ncbi:MAG: hypothetical protein M0R23_05815 [Bacteroidales bacterium]|nr:hypothetical protein [Bacteroidales bacterium]
MKKILLLLAVLLINVSALSAQTKVEQIAKDNFGAWGAHIGYTGWGTALGVHGDFVFNQFRGRAGADLIFGYSHFGLGLNVDMHYVFELPVEGLAIYPIAGLNAVIGGYHYDYAAFHFGVNIGAGIEYDFGNGWMIYADGKYDLNIVGYPGYYRSYFGFSKKF